MSFAVGVTSMERSAPASVQLEDALGELGAGEEAFD